MLSVYVLMGDRNHGTPLVVYEIVGRTHERMRETELKINILSKKDESKFFRMEETRNDGV